MIATITLHREAITRIAERAIATHRAPTVPAWRRRNRRRRWYHRRTVLRWLLIALVAVVLAGWPLIFALFFDV